VWHPPQDDLIETKLTKKRYQTRCPLILFACSIHDDVDAHVDSLPQRVRQIDAHLMESDFEAVFIFNGFLNVLNDFRVKPGRLFPSG